MLEHARAAVRYLGPATAADLQVDDQKFSAVLWRVAHVGETAASLLRDDPVAAADLPVRAARAMRNLLLHDYPEIDAEAVEATVRTDFPSLITQIETMLGEEPSP